MLRSCRHTQREHDNLVVRDAAEAGRQDKAEHDADRRTAKSPASERVFRKRLRSGSGPEGTQTVLEGFELLYPEVGESAVRASTKAAFARTEREGVVRSLRACLDLGALAFSTHLPKYHSGGARACIGTSFVLCACAFETKSVSNESGIY
ncbi:unnamed protein product [Pylaiella littoralis]